jgi:curved DNA-binding protein CbpA
MVPIRLERMTRAEPTHYERLGVARSASAVEIRAAYRRLARRTHPDVNGSGVDSMAAVNEAWRVLGDPARRAEYDALLTPRARRPGPAPNGAASRPSPAADRPAPAPTSGPAPRPGSDDPRPWWWNEPVPDEPESDLPITDGRVVQAFGLLVAVAATIALVVVGLLFAYAIFWSK